MSSTMPCPRKEPATLDRTTQSTNEAPRPVRDGRMQRLLDRRDCLGREGRRSNFVDNAEFLVYHWSGTG
ncbi:MAG: hypothetical protein WAO21_15020, partial [Verrucomicrobiia bacterium]